MHQYVRQPQKPRLWDAPLRAFRAQRSGHPDAFKIYNLEQMKKVYATLPHLHSWLPEVRLVTICEGNDDDPLRCTVEKASIYERPMYEALSYTWSQQEHQQQQKLDTRIEINGISVAILPNLYFALRRLRYPNLHRRIWIDYLCIDQSNVKERNVQVAMMGEIYLNASQVVCYIGEEESSGDAIAIGLQQAISDLKLKENDHLSQLEGHWPNEAYDSLLRMWQRPWFSRIWTVQEIKLAKTGILVCGNHELSWNVVCRAAGHLTSHALCCSTYMRANPSLYKLPAAAERIWDRATYGGSYGLAPLARLLSIYWYCDATDPRDRLYGLLGLMKPENRPFAPDYSLSITEVFKQAAIAVMQKEKYMNFLATFAHLLHLPGRLVGLPTWAADLTTWISPDFTENVIEQYRACGGCSQSRFAQVDEHTISYSGMFVESIAWVGELYPELGLICDPLSVSSARAVLAYLEDLEKFVIQHLGPWETFINKPPSEEQRPPESSRFSRASMSVLHRIVSLGTIGTNGSECRRILPHDYLLLQNVWLALEKYSQMPADTPTSKFEEQLDSEEAREDARSILQFFARQRLLITESGRLGAAPRTICVGDKVTVFQGGYVPFILRSTDRPPPSSHRLRAHSSEPRYLIVGVAYVEGIMNGETVDVVLESWYDWNRCFTCSFTKLTRR